MAMLHPAMLACTVLIRTKESTATGFMMARPNRIDYTAESSLFEPARTVHPDWRFWFVTCAHAIEGSSDDIVTIEINHNDQMRGKITWNYRKEFWVTSRNWAEGRYEHDVAVAPAPIGRPDWSRAMKGCIPPHQQINRAKMEEAGLSESDEIYLIGYPLGIGQQQRNWPLVRQGILAQCRPYLQEDGKLILIDGAVWEGSSGSPVISKPTLFNVEGTKANDKAWLVGMVTAVAQTERQIKQVKNKYMVNMPVGIGLVVPTEAINRTIDEVLMEDAN